MQRRTDESTADTEREPAERAGTETDQSTVDEGSPGADGSTVAENREGAEMARVAPEEPAVADRPVDGGEAGVDRGEPVPAAEAATGADESTADADETALDTDESTADIDESIADTDRGPYEVVDADRAVDGVPADVPPEALALGAAAGAAGAAGATAAASRTPDGDERADLMEGDKVVAALPAAAVPVAVPGSAAELPLIDDGQADRLRTRWRDVQASFVDGPDQAVRSAAELLDEALRALTATLADPRDRADEPAEQPRTEELRVELRRYRTAFQRVLGG